MKRFRIFLCFLLSSTAHSFLATEIKRATYLLNASTLPTSRTKQASDDHTQQQLKYLQRKLTKQIIRTCRPYNMLETDDHIMVCISGGKDSATMLQILLNLQRRFERTTPFRLTAVHLNQMQPGYNDASLIEWLDDLGVSYRIVTEDTYTIVKDQTQEGKTYCSLCSRLRRGILYSVAHELGCNKIALGHHGDDAVETMLLNAVHGGKLKAIPARYYSNTRDMHVIRPLIQCQESDIREFSKLMEFPILPCNLCGSQTDSHRAQVKLIARTLSALGDKSNANMIRALSNIEPRYLLDTRLRENYGMDPVTGVPLEHGVNSMDPEDLDAEDALW